MCFRFCQNWKTSNRHVTQSCADKLSIFVLNSHLDPIGEQHDVQYLSISCVYMVYIYINKDIYIYIERERATFAKYENVEYIYIYIYIYIIIYMYIYIYIYAYTCAIYIELYYLVYPIGIK